MEQLEEKVKQAIRAVLAVREDEITPETSLTEDLGADSLDVIEISMELETVFGISFENDAMDSVVTVKDLMKATARAIDPTYGMPQAADA